jgi:hypothetical protein
MPQSRPIFFYEDDHELSQKIHEDQKCFLMVPNCNITEQTIC